MMAQAARCCRLHVALLLLAVAAALAQQNPQQQPALAVPCTLSPDMPECFIRGGVRVAETQRWRFNVPQQQQASFNIVIELRGIRGDAALALYGPSNTYTAQHQYLSVPSLDSVFVPKADLQASPGSWTIVITGVADRSTFKLSITTPSADQTVKGSSDNPAGPDGYSEAQALRDIYERCCAIDDNEMGTSCDMLSAATAPSRPWQQDICQQPPNQCDDEGYLTRLVLPGSLKGNFVCSGGFQAAEFGSFRRLQVLDLSNNWITGGFAAVSQVLGPMTGLRSLYMSVNLLEGQLECGALQALTQLEVLWLNWNSMVGSLPSCLSLMTNLKELVMSSNGLYGTLPQLSALSGLEMLDVADNGDTRFIGVQGRLPSTLNPVLDYLDVSNNNITGAVPTPPPSLSSFLLEGNKFSATLPSSLSAQTALRSLWASRNKISGALPAGLQALSELVHLEVADNTFTGALPLPGQDNAVLSVVDASRNQLSGPIPATFATLPSLGQLLLRGNRLSGGLGPLLGALPPGNNIRALDVADNALTGSLPSGVGVLGVFALPPVPSYQALLDVSGNQLSGPFPSGLISALQQLSSSVLRSIQVLLDPQASSQAFTCPPGGTSSVSVVLQQAERLYELTCWHPVLGEVYLSQALQYTANGANPSQSPLDAPSPGPAPAPPGTSPIIGIAVGGVVGGAVLAAAAFYMLWRRKLSTSAQQAGGGAAAGAGAHPGSIFYNNPISAPDVPSAAGVGPALSANTLRLDVGVRGLASQGWLQQTRKNVKMAMSGVISGGGRSKGASGSRHAASSRVSSPPTISGAGAGPQWTSNPGFQVYASEGSRRDLGGGEDSYQGKDA